MEPVNARCAEVPTYLMERRGIAPIVTLSDLLTSIDT
jgi:hypothetical protein